MNKTTGEIIIYGGAFNPPTIAHSMITKACIEIAEERGAQVWILPSGSRFDKTIPVTREQRLSYITAMIEDIVAPKDTVAICTDELDRTEPTQTCDTVMEFKRRYPHLKQTWVFGADSYVSMPSWKGGDWLIENVPMLIFKRIGTDDSAVIQTRNTKLLSLVTPEVSSTQVRTLLESGSDISQFVGSHVKRLLVR